MFKSIIATFFGLYLFYLFINAIVKDIKYKREFKVKVEKLTSQLEEIDWEETDNQWEIVKKDYEDTVKKIKEHESAFVNIMNHKGPFLNGL